MQRLRGYVKTLCSTVCNCIVSGINGTWACLHNLNDYYSWAHIIEPIGNSFSVTIQSLINVTGFYRVNPEIRTLPFTTMDEMSRQSKVGVMVVNNSAAHTYLMSSQLKVERRILAIINAHKEQSIVGSTKEAIDKVSNLDSISTVANTA